MGRSLTADYERADTPCGAASSTSPSLSRCQASAFALSWSNSVGVIEPLSSRALAEVI